MREGKRAAVSAALVVGFLAVAWLQVLVAVLVVVQVLRLLPGSVAVQIAVPLTIATGGVLWFATVRALRLRHRPPAGVRVTRQDAPALWQMVDAAAGAAGVKPPDGVTVVADATATLAEQLRLGGLRGGRRDLLLGMPLLLAWDEARLRAVVAHELAHASARLGRFAPMARRGRLAISRIVPRIPRRSPTGPVLRAYARWFRTVDAPFARAQELAADQIAASFAGLPAAAAELRDGPALDGMQQLFHAEYLSPGWQAGYVPDDIFGGFLRVLAARADEMARLRATDPPPSPPGDAHAALADRWAALLESLPAPSIPAAPGAGIASDAGDTTSSGSADDAVTPGPASGVADPAAVEPDPDPGAPDRESGGSGSSSGSSEPERAVPDRDMGASDQEPAASGRDVDASGLGPAVPDRDVDRSGLGPAVSGRDVDASGLGPAVPDRDVDASGLGPAVPDRDVDASGLGPAASDQASGASDRRLAPSDRDPGAPDREVTAPVGEPAGGRSARAAAAFAAASAAAARASASAPAGDLVPDLPGLGRALQAVAFPPAGRAVVGWDEFFGVARFAEMEREADASLRALSRAAGRPVSSTVEVLDLAAEGELWKIAEKMFAGLSAEQTADRIADLITLLFALAALTSGVARWRHSWTGTAELVSIDGSHLDLAGPAALAADPATVGVARKWLAGMGIDLAGAAGPEERRLARVPVLGGVVNVLVDGARTDLLVVETGLVLVPGLPRSRYAEAKRRLTRLAAEGVLADGSWAGGQPAWIPQQSPRDDTAARGGAPQTTDAEEGSLVGAAASGVVARSETAAASEGGALPGAGSGSEIRSGSAGASSSAVSSSSGVSSGSQVSSGSDVSGSAVSSGSGVSSSGVLSGSGVSGSGVPGSGVPGSAVSSGSDGPAGLVSEPGSGGRPDAGAGGGSHVPSDSGVGSGAGDGADAGAGMDSGAESASRAEAGPDAGLNGGAEPSSDAGVRLRDGAGSGQTGAGVSEATAGEATDRDAVAVDGSRFVPFADVKAAAVVRGRRGWEIGLHDGRTLSVRAALDSDELPGGWAALDEAVDFLVRTR